MAVRVLVMGVVVAAGLQGPTRISPFAPQRAALVEVEAPSTVVSKKPVQHPPILFLGGGWLETRLILDF